MSTNYKRLSKQQLLQKCSQSGIQHASKIKRTDLIQLLIENDLQNSNQQLDLEINPKLEEDNKIHYNTEKKKKDNKKDNKVKKNDEKETRVKKKKSKKKYILQENNHDNNDNATTLNLDIPITTHNSNHDKHLGLDADLDADLDTDLDLDSTLELNIDSDLNICQKCDDDSVNECEFQCYQENYCRDNCCCDHENQFTNHQEMNKLTNLLQLIGLKNILDQNNNQNNNHFDNSNNSESVQGEEISGGQEDAGATDSDKSITSGNSNEILSTLFYFLSNDFKKKILEKEEDWSQKKKIQDWEQYQLDKIQLITQRPCLPTQERFHLISGELVDIDTEIIKQQDDFFEYTEHFLTKQDMMEKTFYYTSKFESDAGGQAIRCMREAYQLLKYQLQFLLNRWTKHQQQLLENPDIQPQPLKEIYFINIIHGDVAEHYVKNLLYLKNQEKYKDIIQFVMIGDLTYFALYWIQYHRENFVSWEKYQLQKETINTSLKKTHN